ncbi:hypothetical protein AB0M22_19780 [Nocardia sp. NPDC051756]|uniref:hypothetical protein n=1 Tax=Nocardia sp. NPDC051756 TaxID=3154751 RepID=UPI0034210C75
MQTELVVLEPSDVPTAHALAELHGIEVQQVPRRGIEPVTTVTLVLIGSITAVGAVMQGLEQRKGGQVIDLRPGVSKAIYRTPDVVYGTVIVMTADGVVTVEVKEPEGMFGKIVAALPGMLAEVPSGADEVADAISNEYPQQVAIERRQIEDAESDE